MKLRLPKPTGDTVTADHQQKVQGAIEQALEQVNPLAQLKSGGGAGAVLLKNTVRDYDQLWSTNFTLDVTSGGAIVGIGNTGSTLSSWHNLAKSAIELGNCSMMAYPSNGNSDNLYIVSNAYYDASGNWKYKATGDQAVMYQLSPNASNGHEWADAGVATGTAGATATFATRMQLNTGGGLTIFAPVSNTQALVVHGQAGQWTQQILAPNSANNSYGLVIEAGTTATDTALYVLDATGTYEYVHTYGNGQTRFNASLHGPSGAALFYGSSGGWAVEVLGVNSLNNSYGMLMFAGSSSSDQAFTIDNAAQTLTYMEVRGDGAVALPQIGTTASAATMWVGTSGLTNLLLRSTSSLRYKANVQTLADADLEMIMQMRPVTYTSTSQWDDPTVQHLGFIAEELDLIDKRLVQYTPSQYQQFKRANADGIETHPVADSPKVPETVSYDRITVLLVGAVQALAQRVTQLEAQVAANTATLAPSLPSGPAVAAPTPTITAGGAAGITGSNVFNGALTPITTIPLQP